tara:strand:+ start:359 stop:862 length:504 start_codon:yes stop_codon:yes gene_type:complete
MNGIVSNQNWEQRLADLLSELASVQEELLSVLDRKREMMIQADASVDAEVQARELALVDRLQKCHDRRAEMLEEAQGEGQPSSSLRELAIAVADKQPTESLAKQLDVTKAKMRLLQHHSLTNWVLAQRSLLHVSQILAIIATGGRIQPTYGKGESAHTLGSLVDRSG